MHHAVASRYVTSLAALLATFIAATAPARADADVLWRIVHDQCVPEQLRNLDPTPCAEVDVSAGEDRGYAVVKDSDGVRQYLLIPTARITGIEDPALREPGAPNYFALAWRARSYTEAQAGGALPRDWISLAVNSIGARTQNQLHIHIDCLRADVHEALRGFAAPVGSGWSPLPVPLAGHHYEVRAIGDLDTVNPFALDPEPDPELSTLVVVGAGTEEHPGFLVLRRRPAPGSPDLPAGEELQDHTSCAAPVAPNRAGS